LFSLPLKAVLTIESYDVIAIAALGDWLQLLASVFRPMRSKTKTNRILLYALFFPRFEQVTGNCQEFCLAHRAVCCCYDWSE